MSVELTSEPLQRWRELNESVRFALAGKLCGLYGAPTDEAAFDALAPDKQQALLLLHGRMNELGLWPVVRSIDNVYGLGGTGMSFAAWPFILSTLQQRRDFTRLFANHGDTTGGFYERGRATAVLHFLYVDAAEQPRRWAVHFDLHSPVHSPVSAFRHLRHEALGGVTPDCQAIKKCLV